MADECNNKKDPVSGSSQAISKKFPGFAFPKKSVHESQQLKPCTAKKYTIYIPFVTNVLADEEEFKTIIDRYIDAEWVRGWCKHAFEVRPSQCQIDEYVYDHAWRCLEDYGYTITLNNEELK